MMVGSKVDYDISNLYIPKDSKGDEEYQKSFNATLTIIVRDKDGNVIKRYKQKSHSPTSNFIGLMLPVSYYGALNVCWTLTTTSNTTFKYVPANNSCANGNFNFINYPGNGDNYNVYLINIMVGSGTQSNPYNTYNLASPIANGSGTGKLLYSSPTIPTNITINGNQAYFIVSQTFTNQSGGTITISEVGLIISITVSQTNENGRGSGNILTWYDVLSSPISVGSGQSTAIYYTFSVNA
jgi:hypothetical protein